MSKMAEASTRKEDGKERLLQCQTMHVSFMTYLYHVSAITDFIAHIYSLHWTEKRTIYMLLY